MSSLLDPRQPTRERQVVEKPDFSAVILVGTGDNLYPFNQGTNVLPKALMPVGNVAIINLVLDWVFAAGLTDILIIVPPSAEAAVSEYLHQSYNSESHPRAHISLKSYADGEDDDEDNGGAGAEFVDIDERAGTARLLKRFRSLIKTDFVLLPCDISFPSTLTLASILDKHRATPDAVMTSVLYEAPEAVRESEDKMLVGADKETDEFLFIQPLETLEEDLELRMGLVASHPTLSLSTRLLDAHVYVFRRTVLDLLATRRSKDLTSVREQFVPWLIKGAWQNGLGHEWTKILCPPRRDPLSLALSRSVAMPWAQAQLLDHSSLPGSAASDTIPLPATTPSAGEELAAFKAAVAKDGKSRPRRREPVPWTCRVVVSRPSPEAVAAAAVPAGKGNGGGGGGGGGGKGGKQAGKDSAPEPEYLVRANSLAGYWEVNRRIVRSLAASNNGAGAGHGAVGVSASTGAAPAAATAADEIASSAQISPDSLIGDGVRVGDRASIKKCIVGRHCNIGKGAKLTGCVLWDWVTVEDNARLENVILCGNVRIGEKAQIKDCEFGPGFEALPGAVIKGERLVAGQEV